VDSGSAVLLVDAGSAGADVGGADRALAKAGAAAWRAAHTLSSEPKNAQGWAGRGAALPCCWCRPHTVSTHAHLLCMSWQSTEINVRWHVMYAAFAWQA
jgi:hypothetical protein